MNPRQLLLMGGRFDWASLFANGEPGALFYLDDALSVSGSQIFLFQDSAGTIPVTQVGDPVGLYKDRSGRGNHRSQITDSCRPKLGRNAQTGRLCLQYDGLDDFLSGSIDLTGTNKLTVFAGVRKLSDSASAFVVEFANTSTTNNGTFAVLAPNGVAANFSFRSRGTGDSVATAAGYPSPYSAVLTGIGDIGADISILRVNGAQVASNPADQGTGNYGNYTCYYGARGGTSVFFGGEETAFVVRGAQTQDGFIVRAERSLVRMMGINF